MRERERTPFGRRVWEARTEAKLTQKELCKAAGMAQSTLAEAETTAHGSSFTAQIAAATGVSAEWLASGTGPKRPLRLVAQPVDQPLEYAGRVPEMRRITVVGTAKLGEDGYYEEISSIPGAGDGYIDAFSSDPDAYALRVRGNSMHPAIRDGWYVVIEPNRQPVVTEYVLVKLRNGQKMVKELLAMRSDSIEIESVNGGARRTFYNDELDSVQPVKAVLGRSSWKPD